MTKFCGIFTTKDRWEKTPVDIIAFDFNREAIHEMHTEDAGPPVGLTTATGYRAARDRSAETPLRARRRELTRWAPRADRYERLKRALDLTLSISVLPLLLPLVGLCALAILCSDSAPVLFVQHRTGRGGRRFPMVKFRTMVNNAELIKTDFAHLNSQEGPDFKIPDDPRVTRVGRFLRRTSLDELPQFWNVLRGDMSLVGPRPTSFEASTYDLWHTERLEVAPGLTGLWQVTGRSDIGFDDRVRLDIAYVRRRSLALDLEILAHTAAAVWRGDGAY
jgi:lipopolysaccharide/colanic/teichoic acid biosynthesis glycosyltransferase